MHEFVIVLLPVHTDRNVEIELLKGYIRGKREAYSDLFSFIKLFSFNLHITDYMQIIPHSFNECQLCLETKITYEI